MYLDHRSLPDIARRVANVAYPAYSGQKFRLEQATTLEMSSYWSGGSRDTYVFVRLADMAAIALPNTWDASTTGQVRVELPEGIIAVKHTISLGKDMGLTFYVRNPQLLPVVSHDEVTDDMAIVLTHTAALKNTYGGRSDIRFTEASSGYGITRERWDAASTTCIAAGYLNRAGAVTPNGRNVANDKRSQFRVR